MQQYYLNNELEHSVSIKDTRFHYLKNVIRIKKGEHILLFNGIDKAEYEISEINQQNIILKKFKDIMIHEQELDITLLTGLLKKNNTELIIQKTVELGVKNIILAKFKNSVVKFNDKFDKKIKRFEEIVISACEQSKRNSLAKINYLDSIKKINFSKYDHVYLLYEQEESTKTLYKEINKCVKQSKILLIIGPEGGFDSQEIAYFQANNIIFTSLGNNILRAETAAIMAVGLTVNILHEK